MPPTLGSPSKIYYGKYPDDTPWIKKRGRKGPTDQNIKIETDVAKTRQQEFISMEDEKSCMDVLN